MFKPHKNICSSCGNEAIVVVKKILCAKCNHEQKQAKRKAAGKKPSKSFQSYAYKEPTGELALFKTLLEVRGAKSQISGEPLIGFDIRWFSHVLSKGAYPAFRLFDRNIILKTPREHELWGTQKHKLRDNPKWKWVFDLEQELKELYYRK